MVLGQAIRPVFGPDQRPSRNFGAFVLSWRSPPVGQNAKSSEKQSCRSIRGSSDVRQCISQLNVTSTPQLQHLSLPSTQRSIFVVAYNTEREYFEYECIGFSVNNICPIAIAYSMGQIIKSFCVCARVCVRLWTLTVAFLRRFSPNWTQTCKPTKVRTSSLGVNIAPPLSLFSP